MTVRRRFERKNFSAKKVDYSSTFFSFRLRNPFADQSESKSPWQGGTTDQWVTHSSACDVNRSSEMAKIEVATQNPSSNETETATTVIIKGLHLHQFVTGEWSVRM